MPSNCLLNTTNPSRRSPYVTAPAKQLRVSHDHLAPPKQFHPHPPTEGVSFPAPSSSASAKQHHPPIVDNPSSFAPKKLLPREKEEAPEPASRSPKSKSSDAAYKLKKQNNGNTQTATSPLKKSQTAVKYVIKQPSGQTSSSPPTTTVSSDSAAPQLKMSVDSLEFSPLQSPQVSPLVSPLMSPLQSPNSSTDEFDPAAYWVSLQKQYSNSQQPSAPSNYPPQPLLPGFTTQQQFPLQSLDPYSQQVLMQQQQQYLLNPQTVYYSHQGVPYYAQPPMLQMNSPLNMESKEEEIEAEESSTANQNLSWQQQELLQREQHHGQRGGQRRSYKGPNTSSQFRRKPSDNSEPQNNGSKSRNSKGKSGENITWQQKAFLKRSY